ncbi:hypothetical protein ACSSS7_002598 [Eimeria intestinalis]
MGSSVSRLEDIHRVVHQRPRKHKGLEGQQQQQQQQWPQSSSNSSATSSNALLEIMEGHQDAGQVQGRALNAAA